jgi:deoxyribonuclease-4
MSLSFRFGTVGSPISTPRSGSANAAAHMPSLGLSAIELGWVRSVRVSEKTCAAIKSAAVDNGVALSVHAPYYINLNGDEEEWPKSRKRLMDAAHYGYLAGADYVVFHPGSYGGQAPDAVWAHVTARLRGCVDELREAANPIILRPETMGKQGQLGSLEDCLQIAKGIRGVEPCLDFAHLHARPGDGSLNSRQEWLEVLERYEEALGSSALQNLGCHLSGIEYTARGEKRHLVMAEADFELEQLFTALHEKGCCGRILSESPIMEEDARLFKETWMRVSGETGV